MQSDLQDFVIRANKSNFNFPVIPWPDLPSGPDGDQAALTLAKKDSHLVSFTKWSEMVIRRLDNLTSAENINAENKEVNSSPH